MCFMYEKDHFDTALTELSSHVVTLSFPFFFFSCFLCLCFRRKHTVPVAVPDGVVAGPTGLPPLHQMD